MRAIFLALVGILAMAVPASAADVSYVVDGDTIRLRSGEYVRIIGIDTPERGRCGYAKARDTLESLIINNTVALVNPSEVDDKDRYGRLLRYVQENNRDLGLTLIRRGLADARYDSLDGYDWHPRQARYRTADANNPDVCG